MKNLSHRLAVKFSSKPGWKEGKGEEGVWYLESRRMESLYGKDLSNLGVGSKSR